MVPNEIAVGLLEKAIRGLGSNKILVDGFPRELSQAI